MADAAPRTFAITFDYLCPFARNANEHIVEALRDGAPWDVTFTPYSQMQGSKDADSPAVWEVDDPRTQSGVLALLAGLAVRDHLPDRFLDVHLALFAARHDDGLDIKDEIVIRDALASAGVDADAVFAIIDDGEPLDTLRKEHEGNVREHAVWGVPTFISSDRAMFARLLTRPEGDPGLAARTIERIVDLVDGFPELHELKQTDIPV